MSQVFASSWDIITVDNIQNIIIEENINDIEWEYPEDDIKSEENIEEKIEQIEVIQEIKEIKEIEVIEGISNSDEEKIGEEISDNNIPENNAWEDESVNVEIIEEAIEDSIGEPVSIPEFNIIFQNPSYILEKDLIKNEYFCDPEKDICKINIKVLDLLGEDIWSHLSCETKYSHSFETDDRCNPTTFILEEDIEILYKIFEKNNSENYKEKKIVFKAQENIVDETIEKNEYQDNEENITSSGSQENTWSWIIETWSRIIEPWSWEIDKVNKILPEIILEIQSGLDYSGTWNIYMCQKEECKINLDVTESFTGILIENDYECDWDFSSWIFTVSNTETKCNPWYVNYWSWIHEVSIKVIEKDNIENFISKVFYIHNIKEIDIDTDVLIDTDDDTEIATEQSSDDYEKEDKNTGSWTIEEWVDTLHQDNWVEVLTWTWFQENTWTWEIVQEVIILPEILLIVQSGLAYTGTWNIYTCDKEECKINLDISESFTWHLDEADYLCEWIFWSWSFKTADTDKKCNPWYVEFPAGLHEVWIKILIKNNNENYIEKNIFIDNTEKNIQEIVIKESNWGWSSWTLSKSKQSTVDITLNKKIEVQSWLNDESICEEELCKINLQYESSSYETCEWDFWNIDVKETYITTCNPGFIYYPSWKYKISLRVKNNKINSLHIKTLEISNIYIHKEQSDDKEEWGNHWIWKTEKIEDTKKKIHFDIELQGKKVDYKKYIWDKIICFWVDKCSINLKTKNSTKYLYYWSFDNGELSTKSNPSAVWFNSGSYLINLVVQYEGQEIFTKNISIEVIPPEIPEDQKIIAQEFITELDKQDNLIFQISDNISADFFTIKNIKNKIQKKNIQNLLENTEKSNKKLKKDISKKIDYLLQPKQYISWFENKNKEPKLKLTRNISKQKKALKFSWVTNPHSTVFIVQWDEIIEMQSDDTGKYELKQKELTVGNYDLEYYVLDQYWNFFESKKLKSLSLNNDYVAQINAYNEKQKYIVNNIKKKKYISKKEKKEDMKQIINNTEYASIIPSMNKNKTREDRIFQTLLILLSLLWISILLRKYKIL
jgi:hypothetical protein